MHDERAGGRGTGRTTDGRPYRLVQIVDVPSREIRVRAA